MMFGKAAASREEVQELQRIQMRFRNTFANEDGPFVLGWILRTGGWWSRESTDMTSQQLCQAILEAMGTLHENNTNALVQGYLNAGQVNPLITEEGT